MIHNNWQRFQYANPKGGFKHPNLTACLNKRAEVNHVHPLTDEDYILRIMRRKAKEQEIIKMFPHIYHQ